MRGRKNLYKYHALGVSAHVLLGGGGSWKSLLLWKVKVRCLSWRKRKSWSSISSGLNHTQSRSSWTLPVFSFVKAKLVVCTFSNITPTIRFVLLCVRGTSIVLLFYIKYYFPTAQMKMHCLILRWQLGRPSHYLFLIYDRYLIECPVIDAWRTYLSTLGFHYCRSSFNNPISIPIVFRGRGLLHKSPRWKLRLRALLDSGSWNWIYFYSTLSPQQWQQSQSLPASPTVFKVSSALGSSVKRLKPALLRPWNRNRSIKLSWRIRTSDPDSWWKKTLRINAENLPYTSMLTSCTLAVTF
jgi:hypothetical protein